MTDDAAEKAMRRQAEAAMDAAAALAARDPRRPRYHFRARAQWMNDPNGPLFHNGWYHLFYQANPFGERCWGVADARVCWGHARSRDLVRWEHLPIAIWPSLERGEEHCWSGSCVIRDDGTPMIFYTSIGPGHPSKDGAEQWAALGDADLLTWRKHPRNPVVSGTSFGGARLLEWRDPFVFREGDGWYMATGGHREGRRGCLSLFRSPDLEHWTFVGFPVEGDETNWECPALFRLGDRWALVYSPHGPVRYCTGRMDFARGCFEPERHGRFDYGSFVNLYAATAMPLPDGRTLLWAWMFSNEKGRAWNGCMALPRELSLLPDGRIAQRPAREFETLRRDPQEDTGGVREGKPRRYAVPGGCAEVRLTTRRLTAASLGLRLLVRGGAAADVAWPSMPWVPDEEMNRLRSRRVTADIIWTKEGLTALGDRVPPEELGPCPSHELRLFMDRSLVEVFVNGRLSVSRWIDADSIEAVELYTEGGDAEEMDIRVWRMEEAMADRPASDGGGGQ